MRSAASTAFASWDSSFTFETPTDEPAHDGFTKTGNPSPSMRVVSAARDAGAAHSAREKLTYLTCGSPTAADAACMKILSIPTADAATPHPTYGTPSASNRPWTTPSSPTLPWTIGKTT